MSVADQITSYLKTRLALIREGQTITLGSGAVYTFQTDAGGLVNVRKEYLEQEDARPWLVLFVGKKSNVRDDDTPCGREDHLLDISIEGSIDDDKAGSVGDDLKQDIVCLLKADRYFGGLLSQPLEDIQADSETQVGDEIFSVVNVSFTARYSTAIGAE